MNTIIKISPMLVLVFGLSSCLKDELYTGDTNLSPNVVEFSVPPTNSASEEYMYPEYSKSFGFADEVDYPVTVSYSGINQAPSDITVDIQVDPSMIAPYNAQIIAYARAKAIAEYKDPDDAEAEAESKLVTQAPANYYSIPSNQVVIKKGERKAIFMIKVKSSLISFDKKYVIPFRIRSASGSVISANFSAGIFHIVTKNDYDGVYELSGTMTDNTNATLTGYYPDKHKIELRTINVNTVAYYEPDIPDFGHLIKTSTGLSYYGAFSPQFTIVGDNVTQVTNYYGQPSANGRSGKLDPSGINKYTVSGTSKKIEVKYIMVQGGVDRTVFTETFTYVGPRD